MAHTSVSLVIPCYNEADTLPALIHTLQCVIQESDAHACICEIIIVDDGSTDDTWSMCQRYSSHMFKAIRLSRNFGQQAALLCGYRAASGEVIVSLDADLQDPPECIWEMVALYRKGADIVYGVRRSRAGESLFKRVTADVFYRCMASIIGSHFQQQSGDFRLLSRKALREVLRNAGRRPFLRALTGWIGLPSAVVYFDRPQRCAGTTKYNLAKMVRLATDGLITFSRAPLLVPFALCLPCAVMSVVCGILTFFVNTPVWASGMFIASVACLIGTCICSSLGVLGLYLGMVLDECQRWPAYVVQEDNCSPQRVVAQHFADSATSHADINDKAVVPTPPDNSHSSY